MLVTIGRLIGFVGGACGLIATVAIFLLPMYEGVSVTVTSNGERVEQLSHKTLLEMQSLEPLTILFFSGVVALSLVAIYGAIRARARRYGLAMLVAGVLLLLTSFISGFSVGGFYLPGALMVFVAGILMRLGTGPKEN
jgi:O-antigen ligase